MVQQELLSQRNLKTSKKLLSLMLGSFFYFKFIDKEKEHCYLLKLDIRKGV